MAFLLMIALVGSLITAVFAIMMCTGWDERTPTTVWVAVISTALSVGLFIEMNNQLKADSKQELERAVAAAELIYERYGGYTPSVADLQAVDPQINAAAVEVDAAPVSEQVQIRVNTEVAVLEGPVLGGDAPELDSDQLARLAE